jgi:hypothetical protein
MYGTLISTQTLASTAASVTFSSIPGTYTDLYIAYSIQGNTGAVNDSLQIALNGQTAASARTLAGNGSAASSNVGFTGNGSDLDRHNTGNYTANTFTSGLISIPNYLQTAPKAISTDFAMENNAALSWAGITANLLTNAAAVTSITFTTSNGTGFAAGCVFSLYGLSHF